MMRSWCLPLVLLASNLAWAADNGAAPIAASPSQIPAAAATLFSQPVILRGTLGELKMQMHLAPDLDSRESVEGDYFVFGRSGKILLAGELDGDALSMEESRNGTDVSGQWSGKLEGGTLRGTWLSVDGSVSTPFVLKVVPDEAGAKSAKSAKPKKPTVKPAQLPANAAQ